MESQLLTRESRQSDMAQGVNRCKTVGGGRSKWHYAGMITAKS